MIKLKITEYGLKNGIAKSGLRAFREQLEVFLPHVHSALAVSLSNYGVINKLGLYKIDKTYQVDSSLVENVFSDNKLCLYRFKRSIALDNLSNSYKIIDSFEANSICDLSELIFFGQQLHCEVLNHALNGNALVVYHDMEALFYLELLENSQK